MDIKVYNGIYKLLISDDSDIDKLNPILLRKGREILKKYFSLKEPILNKEIPIVIIQNKILTI